MRVSMKVGEFNVSSSEGDFRECMAELQFLTDAPKVCPVCDHNLNLNYRNVKSSKDGKRYRYFGLLCANPDPIEAHEKTFGQFEDGSGLFWKWNDQEAPWVRVGDVRGGSRDGGGQHEEDDTPPARQGARSGYETPQSQRQPQGATRPQQGQQRTSQYERRG